MPPSNIPALLTFGSVLTFFGRVLDSMFCFACGQKFLMREGEASVSQAAGKKNLAVIHIKRKGRKSEMQGNFCSGCKEHCREIAVIPQSEAFVNCRLRLLLESGLYITDRLLLLLYYDYQILNTPILIKKPLSAQRTRSAL